MRVHVRMRVCVGVPTSNIARDCVSTVCEFHLPCDLEASLFRYTSR